jgi:hypothetical protein
MAATARIMLMPGNFAPVASARPVFTAPAARPFHMAIWLNSNKGYQNSHRIVRNPLFLHSLRRFFGSRNCRVFTRPFLGALIPPYPASNPLKSHTQNGSPPRVNPKSIVLLDAVEQAYQVVVQRVSI